MTPQFTSARFSNVPGIKKTEKLNVLWTLDFFEIFCVKHKGPPLCFYKKGGAGAEGGAPSGAPPGAPAFPPRPRPPCTGYTETLYYNTMSTLTAHF